MLASASLLGGLLAPGIGWAQVVPNATAPQDQAAKPQAGPQAGDIVVTATRRSESTTKIPFNISAYGGDQFARSGVTSTAALSSQVPNLTIQDQGGRGAAQSVPIIRGLNASGSTGAAPRYFQSPVGFYQNNTSIVGSLALLDIARVEILRGPQGTLYGAGALSGAVRFVPVEPKLETFTGFVSAEGSRMSHSDDTGYSFIGAVNVPIGSTVAVRVAAMRKHESGFIDFHDTFKRANNDYLAGKPILANPADVAGSSAVYQDVRDANVTDTTTVRAIVLWKPDDRTKVEATYSFDHSKGIGGPEDNSTYGGGVSPIDPRITLRPTGNYERSEVTLEPWDRKTHLASLDASYEAGFATLSTTLAYGQTKGTSDEDATLPILGTPFAAYYTGIPANPRALAVANNVDDERTYTGEVRLVSARGGAIDYTVGAFYEHQRRDIQLNIYAPGASDFTQASHGGSTDPIAAGGTYVITTPAGFPTYGEGAIQYGTTYQKFREISAFGDVTWHGTDRWQVTGGARFFDQKFSQDSDIINTNFLIDVHSQNATKFRSQIFKGNTSYQLTNTSQAYATFSQGFRRGGANAFPTDGPGQEPAQLLNYQPDKTNNYELGLKGKVGGLRYTADLFYVDWSHPQIDLTTPYTLTYVVINAAKADSKGFELELAGPIGATGFSINSGLAYAKARLSQDFFLPAGSGQGSIVPDAIVGLKGQRLPGAPDWSGSFTLNYDTKLGTGELTLSGGVDYRSSTVSGLPVPGRIEPFYTAPGYALLRASVGYDWNKWNLTLFANNLADKHAVTTGLSRTNSSLSLLGNWGNYNYVTTPRQVGLRVTRNW